MSADVREEHITIRDLQRNAAEVFDRARRGESFVVTRRGEEVGRITPPDPAKEALARAIAEGILDPVALETLPSASEDVGIPREPSRPGSLLGSEAIIALREEERF
ncbi:type II toxin-antitoxin system Phd/YefM family antitoxin [Phytomonospora endophytica]|uniref:Antitoxin n=1 Tax=Phytomonospora endophytica TaxID=714109 RepID=A0A841FGK2_9ACTN|nr:type II toxin-antitoxin system prevent-host-death family antitoxin [Phytomonospora endophytica]MBB6034123.1 prevent-host-death family protein [Phytomonospora endophytica]